MQSTVCNETTLWKQSNIGCTMEFDYSGKTAAEALSGICSVRQYPQPIYLDRYSPDSDDVQVTAIVGGRAYGVGKGKTSALACEKASLETLSAWLKDDFKPNLLRYLEDKSTSAISVAEELIVGGDGAQKNALSIFNLYISAAARERASAPIFDVEEISLTPKPMFSCELALELDSQKFRSKGTGGTKVMAKRFACYELLR